MKRAALLFALALAAPIALAQPPTGKRPAPVLRPAIPLEVGAVVESFEMVPDRTVIFEPTADGKLRILSASDKDRLEPMPRNPGQVAVSLTVAQEIGAVMEFNSGLAFIFSYEATAGGVAIPTCPARGNAVASDQWPQGYTSIVIGKLKRVDGAAVCEHPAE
ncbi:MAG: hypothetical protein B7Y90_15175 [Alphaproteobacteria bacterium 32-64-14]|nr:MAG: hypothetical protein B7Y90_15175 [Alphaproteobacteria bacterium 32-64-14]